MLSSSCQAHKSLPRAENRRQTCPVTNANDVLEDLQRYFSDNHVRILHMICQTMVVNTE